jgi:hypothetical protein
MKSEKGVAKSKESTELSGSLEPADRRACNTEKDIGLSTRDKIGKYAQEAQSG